MEKPQPQPLPEKPVTDWTYNDIVSHQRQAEMSKDHHQIRAEQAILVLASMGGAAIAALTLLQRLG